MKKLTFTSMALLTLLLSACLKKTTIAAEQGTSNILSPNETAYRFMQSHSAKKLAPTPFLF